MMPRAVLLTVLSIALLSPASSSGKEPTATSLDAARMKELWEEPSDIRSRDLYYGPGGRRLVPRTDVTYRVVGLDTTGHSRGYDLLDPNGREWKVKIGEEAQSDLVVSRILWAIGYRQPITYYMREWRMSGAPGWPQAPGRFRLSSDHQVTGEWSWKENPFRGTRQFRGLIVANLILNNWDLTTSNNRVYRVGKPGEGSRRWYVVQDVGGSLGRTRWPIGTRNDIDDFESEALIRRVEGDEVRFAYWARHQALLDDITPADVAWACRLLDRLSEAQLNDAFRAAGYPPGIRARYVRKIREKIQEGLALEPAVERGR
jgi:hypothetical protein